MSSEEEWNAPGQFDPQTDPEEQRVIHACLDSYQTYRRAAHYNVTHTRRQSFYSLPSAHWSLLAEAPFSLLASLDAVDDAIDANADVAEAIFLSNLQSMGGQEGPWCGRATPGDMTKAQSTLRQMYRDWSAEGAAEREASYAPVLAALEAEFASVPASAREGVRVLVPGAGLGRLVLETCLRGFSVEGNEISYHQLMASAFILNHTAHARQFALYPWADKFSNHASRAHQLQRVMIPDVHPAAALEASSADKNVHAFERMSMAAADFCVYYKEPANAAAFDAVTTVFFIDTAPNLIAYIETIRHCLKPGGVWINLGPLLWHFENEAPGSNKDGPATGGTANLGIAESGSFELTDDEVVLLVQRLGFTLERRESQSLQTGYISDPRSMLTNTYRPSFWIARKLPDQGPAQHA
ncbi:uncharacterized protein K452DRAFT_286164 [Aplosporella prunicola CBS 121167]|uniref:carnosine N-methyltransferase n=1 Tax=Aplosporella prunicola CBS 121167 TaxID=1176127 RepID=A0A6A6BGR1_9PEZI|nr:uncharacterized protein K452DRAFT_286164 [Aplosporella prunicola CBS 121167]KAF2143340.1 hypothetical protein K452DRAFT_286164 [Aplosporella prunicola CBS 121167]